MSSDFRNLLILGIPYSISAMTSPLIASHFSLVATIGKPSIDGIMQRISSPTTPSWSIHDITKESQKRHCPMVSLFFKHLLLISAVQIYVNELAKEKLSIVWYLRLSSLMFNAYIKPHHMNDLQ